MVDQSDEFDWFFKILPIVLGGVFLYYMLWGSPEPQSPPENRLVYGCYGTTDGPPIKLDQNGMKVLQDGFPMIGFHLERHKQGIALATEAPIRLEPIETYYRYEIADRGIGQFLDFYKVINGKVYGVFEDNELGPFRMLAMDGRYLPYTKVAASDCGD